MNSTKIAGIVLVILAAVMIAVGTGMLTGLPVTPPTITGIGFLVIAYTLINHRH